MNLVVMNYKLDGSFNIYLINIHIFIYLSIQYLNYHSELGAKLGT